MGRSRKAEEGKVAGGGGLLLVLLRWSRGWWDQATLAAQAGFHRSQVSMWERDDREVPAAALEKTADVTGFPRWLLPPALRLLRAFRAALREKSRPARTLAHVSVVELFPVAVQALDLILEPLSAAEEATAATPEPAEALLERLKRRTERQRRLLVESVPEFRTPELADLLTRESRRLAPDHPEESREWEALAALIADRHR